MFYTEVLAKCPEKVNRNKQVLCISNWEMIELITIFEPVMIRAVKLD